MGVYTPWLTQPAFSGRLIVPLPAIMQVRSAGRNIQARTAAPSPPGTTSVAVHFCAVDHVREVHTSTTPIAQPTTGMTSPPSSSKTNAIRSPLLLDGDLRREACAAMSSGGPSESRTRSMSASLHGSELSDESMWAVTLSTISRRSEAGAVRSAVRRCRRYASAAGGRPGPLPIDVRRFDNGVDGPREAGPLHYQLG